MDPSRRVVLLGASNLNRGLSIVLETARLTWGEPLDVLVATGHDRSYGMNSRVLLRTLPSILACGLWDDLARRAHLPTAALITDVGNDILYGVSVDKLACWIEACLARLAPLCERTVVTQLPLKSLEELAPWRYGLFRSVLAPQCRLALSEALRRAEEVNERLVALSVQYGARLVAPRAEWYGFDPVHIKRRHWPRVWRELLSSWCDDASCAPARGSFARWWRLRRQRPQRRRWLGVEQRATQPSRAWRDGTIVSMY